MSKNLIPEIAQMLGVALGEEFKVVYKTRFEIICNFTLAGLFVHKGDSGKYEKEPLADIICGKAAIVKLPWKPKERDIFYSFDFTYGKWGVKSDMWAGAPCDYALLGKGWIYRTRAEAEAALLAVAKEVGAEYELPTSDTEAIEPWKPKAGEQYYSFGGRFFGDPTVWIVIDVIWQGLAYDVAMFDKGWVYKSKEEAQAALPKVAAEIGVEYLL
ncbi:hypothetical protein [Phascolarctobacterium succinatutens]|uniref:hypothetical protein n=1 Tax=Phascolarctobacterium succinatutens TaxID=626940 RepID=UPI0026F37022|nr:hypothetical protein [Phascolarctobacterium succinatutens]